MMLSSHGIIPPDEWMHDINMKDKYGNSIKSILEDNNYIYVDNKFILNVQTEIK